MTAPPKYLKVTLDAVCDDESPALLRLDASRNASVILESYRGELAVAAHVEGATWQEVGDALGITRQAAQARYDTATRRG